MTFKNQIVAVYGSLRKGLSNHGCLGDSPFLDTTTTKPEFRMWSYGGFPGCTPGGERMVVEVYRVESQATMDRLDRLEGYPNFYNRKIVELENGIKAWVYYIEEPEEWTKESDHIEDWKVFLDKKLNLTL